MDRRPRSPKSPQRPLFEKNMRSFHDDFPDLAERETRVIDLLKPWGPLPAGEYMFIEMYCSRPGCDCEHVMLSVYLDRRQHVATISFALQPDGFADIGCPRAYLDPLNTQADVAPMVLALFELNLANDESYVLRLARHLALAKAWHRRSGADAARRQSRRERRSGRRETPDHRRGRSEDPDAGMDASGDGP